MCLRLKTNKNMCKLCIRHSITHTHIFFIMLLIWLQRLQSQHVLAASVTRGLTRMSSEKIANIYGLQAVPESLSAITAADHRTKDNTKRSTTAARTTTTTTTTTTTPTGKYEIRSVSGEPNYKSVNLTWEVEFIPYSYDSVAKSAMTERNYSNIDAITNRSAEVEPPKAFQIFFCEIQSFGPQRCRSKVVDETLQVHTNNNDGVALDHKEIRHYAAHIDNLRMATKYSFHVRPQSERKDMKITGRSEIFDNDLDDDVFSSDDGETIVIPTKGFSAQATKCLPHTSEIEVETGPYFGGKIVVDGGNCGIKGDPHDPIDKYSMRIDHKMCGSLVKAETNTVETFITVQENLGIFTHSTRRFVVICSFQSGMQTVRASFTVPGNNGVAAAVENDPFEADERMPREQRLMQYVDKRGLVLREDPIGSTGIESPIHRGEAANSSLQLSNEYLEENAHELDGAEAYPEDRINETYVKHENEIVKHEEQLLQHGLHNIPIAHARLAKYDKLVSEQASAQNIVDDANDFLDESTNSKGADDARAFGSKGALHYESTNVGGIILTVLMSILMVGVFIYVVLRESQQSTTSTIRGTASVQPHKHLQQLPTRDNHRSSSASSSSSSSTSSHYI